MVERFRKKETLIKLLKPNRYKLIIFVILIAVLALLPIYPSFTGFQESAYDYNLRHNDRHFPLAQVVLSDFEIVLIVEELNPISAENDVSYFTYNFEPSEMIIYMPYFVLAFFLSCFFGEYLSWKKKYIWPGGVVHR